MPYLVQRFPDFLDIRLIGRASGVEPLGDLVDVPADGGQGGVHPLDIRGVKLRNQFMETIAIPTADHITQYDKEARDIPFYGTSTYLHIWKKPE